MAKIQVKNGKPMAENQSLRDQLAAFVHIEEEYAKFQEKNDKVLLKTAMVKSSTVLYAKKGKQRHGCSMSG